jgi:hypothetical protein
MFLPAVRMTIAAMLLGPALFGCKGVPTPLPVWTTLVEEGSELVLQGDWDDVDAAVRTGASHAEMAVVEGVAEPDRREFQLRSISGETGKMIATRLSPGEPSRIRLVARLGHFGNPEAERRLLGFVAKRLEQLRGVDWAPL